MNHRDNPLLIRVQDHNNWMKNTVNLIASENKLSPGAEMCMVSDLGNRVAEGWAGERFFPGLKFYEQIEEYGISLVKKIYGADFVDPRPISGTMANMVVFTAFTKPGDTIITPSIRTGGHVSMSGATPKKVFNLNVVNFPFSMDDFSIDEKQAIELILRHRPKMVILGGSVILFEQPVEQIVKAAKEVGSIILFDASHVAGLIAGKCFTNPFDQGVDIITMSTCKTIPGPQHAFILSTKEYSESIKRTTFPSIVSGHHLHETVASIYTMEEFSMFGESYAHQVVKNCRRLASEMDRLGFDVLAKNRDFTDTHMFLVDTNKLFSPSEAELRLENANILVNRNMLPTDDIKIRKDGLRIGTPEVTRMGMLENDMDRIAHLIARILLSNEDPKVVRNEVISFREKFQSVKYCYE